MRPGALAEVWRKSRDRIFERVTLLEDAAARLLEAPLGDEQRRDAERAAHQLAGTCGSFGFHDATDIAREAEQLLAGADPIPPNATFRLAEIALALRRQLSASVTGVTEPGVTGVQTAGPDSASVVTAAATNGGAIAVREASAGAGELVLALDDNPLELDVIDAIVTPAGYRVVGTTDPQEVVELLESLKPSMVILDVDMPEASGVEMCRYLRADARWVALPVLFLTARSDADSVARIFEAGADDYTAKPVAGPELVARIRNRLERSRLPHATARTVAADAVGTATGVVASGTTTDVVIVDDDDALVGLLERSLDTCGYSVTTFGDGPRALSALLAGTGEPAAVRARVIVLDVGLPGMDGLTVLRALARDGITRESRVVMLTARTSEQETVQALELGAFDHVAKPFSVPILMKRIQRAFDAARGGA